MEPGAHPKASAERSRTAKIESLFDALNCREGIALIPISPGLLLALSRMTPEGSLLRALVIDVETARGSSANEFLLNSGRITQVTLQPGTADQVEHSPTDHQGRVFDGLLDSAINALRKHPHECRGVTKDTLARVYDRVSTLFSALPDPSVVLNTPLGSLQIARTPDPSSLSNAYQYTVQIFYAGLDRGRSLPGQRFIVRENNFLEPKETTSSTRRELDLLITLAEIRSKLGELPRWRPLGEGSFTQP